MIPRLISSKSILQIASAVITSILLSQVSISCSGDADQSVTGDTQSVGICTLTVVDTIGLAFGDSNYAFGSVDDVYIGSEGRTYVLDKTQLTVFVYDAAGIILKTEYWFMPDLSIGPLEENIREWIEAMDVYVNGNLDMIPLGE